MGYSCNVLKETGRGTVTEAFVDQPELSQILPGLVVRYPECTSSRCP